MVRVPGVAAESVIVRKLFELVGRALRAQIPLDRSLADIQVAIDQAAR
jgi:hypothetical protein